MKKDTSFFVAVLSLYLCRCLYVLLEENLSSERFFPDNSNSSEMLFHTLSEVVIDLLLDNLSFLMCRSLGSYVSLYLRLCT